MLRGVVFDMNGVIIDDERVHQESWRRLCRKYGFHVTEEEFRTQIFGRTELDTLKYLFKDNLDPDKLQSYLNERVQIAMEILGPNPKPTAGVVEFIKNLYKVGIPIALATSSRRPYTQFVLDRFDIKHFFKCVVTAQDIKHGKPDPEIYLTAVECIGVDPLACVAIEDSVSGITSAKRAGMKVIGITTTHSASQLQGADMVIDSFKSLETRDLEKLCS
ncbi:MAG: HAD family phosphatase [bacterium]|nr:HAD family phosphatase [bacterium]